MENHNLKNISSVLKNECIGCRSCAQVCPHNSISILPDEEGFFYPVVDSSTCVDCGLCKTHCPALLPVVGNGFKQEYYAIKSRDLEILNSSASGGLFSVAAKFILNKGGQVFGCAFDENLIAKHICITSESDLKKLQGSKYVSSNTLQTYSTVKDLLKANKKKSYIIFWNSVPNTWIAIFSW